MVDKMDWQAAMDSEVFRNYMAAELRREAEEEVNKPTPAQRMDNEIDEMDRALTAMDKFEEQIRKHPELLAKFKQAKAFLINNPDAHENVDSNFIKGLMMLDLEETK